MISLFQKKSRIEKLKERYTLLMKRSFETALKDISKSKRIHQQADTLLNEIKYCSHQAADN